MQQQLEKYDPKKTYPRARNAMKAGGYLLKFIKAQGYSKAAKNVYNQLQDKIVKGELRDIVNLSKPIETCDSSTYLENIANEVFDVYPCYRKAYDAKDAIDSLKWLVAATMCSISSGLYRLQGRIPLDPLIGETFQGVLSDGASIDCECISNNPPIYTMLTNHETSGFKLHGFYKVNASLNGVNSVWGGSSGKFKFRNKAGNTFDISHADIVIDGALYGQPVCNVLGSVKLICQDLNIVAEIKFDSFKNEYAVAKLAKGIMGMFSSQTETKPTDCFTVQIYQTAGEGKKQQKVTISKGSGSWLSHLEIDGLVYWKHAENQSIIAIPKILLPSDSRIREDRRLIIENKLADAQKVKIELETRERTDIALRQSKK